MINYCGAMYMDYLTQSPQGQWPQHLQYYLSFMWEGEITNSTQTTPTQHVSGKKPDMVHQEYIIKERREYRTYPWSKLNVCGESLTWNANYLTTISKQVILHLTRRCSDYCHSKCMTLHIQRLVQECSILSSLLLCTLGYINMNIQVQVYHRSGNFRK